VEELNDEKFIVAFGKQLRNLRMQNKLSQEDLANDAEIPINQVGRIERAEIKTSLSTIYRLSNALKVKPKELFDFEE